MTDKQLERISLSPDIDPLLEYRLLLQAKSANLAGSGLSRTRITKSEEWVAYRDLLYEAARALRKLRVELAREARRAVWVARGGGNGGGNASCSTFC